MKRLYSLELIFLVVLVGCVGPTMIEPSQEFNRNNSERLQQRSTQRSTVTNETPELKGIYPSDPTLFTQGLEMNQSGSLLLGTGQYGKSDLGLLNLKNGEFNKIYSLEDKYFGEGFTQTSNHLWHLTWKKGMAFQRDVKTNELTGKATYEGEGWGLAYDNNNNRLYMSDGSSTIHVRDPDTFEKVNEFVVVDNNQPIEDLNELEYANGYLYSNVWHENIILKINPETGKVNKRYNITPLLEGIDLSEKQNSQMDSLNGIAHIGGNQFYITGKYYPIVMEVILN